MSVGRLLILTLTDLGRLGRPIKGGQNLFDLTLDLSSLAVVFYSFIHEFFDSLDKSFVRRYVRSFFLIDF